MKACLAQDLLQAGGWMGFEAYMARVLYAPGLGYYNNPGRVFGQGPGDGSDFVTAPEMSPLFGATLAEAVREGLALSDTREVWEFGAGSGALAVHLLRALGDDIDRYTIVDLSGGLRERQARAVAEGAPQHRGKLAFADRLPDAIEGVVVGNEVLDAMPVALLHFDGQQWFERGVAQAGGALVWQDRPTPLRPPHPGPFVPGTVTEIHRQAEAFVATLAGCLRRGLVLFLDYGFPQAEYYHPQRVGGTLMCHQGHRSDPDPLDRPGEKDITAHVNFTGIALAAQDAGLDVLGYTSQAHFLLNLGLAQRLESAELRERSAALRLVTEHEMGELFKVLALGRGLGEVELRGFASGDRTHTL